MPISWNEIQTSDATEEQFNAIPPRKAGRGIDPVVAAIIDDVAKGGIKELRVTDPSHVRGIRVALGRAAAQRGFKLEYRDDGPVLYVRRSQKPLAKPSGGATMSDTEKPKRRARPPKNPQSHPEVEQADLAAPPKQEAAEMLLEDQASALREDEGELAIAQDEAPL